MQQGVRLEVADGIATVTIDRPHVRNAIGLTTIEELRAALAEAATDRSVQVLVLRGAGDRAFVSGGDLNEFAGIRDEFAAAAMARSMRDVLDSLAGFPQPTIAAINGHALGGGAEIVCAADIRLAAADTQIGFTQVSIGIIPAWGGIERLTGLVGRSRALVLIGTGRRLSADEARDFGLVDEVFARSDFDACVATTAAKFASLPPGAAAAIKAVISATTATEHPAVREQAISAFARLWVADTHWSAVEHRAKKAARVPTPPPDIGSPLDR
jgi:enoyl-CoA hydratase